MQEQISEYFTKDKYRKYKKILSYLPFGLGINVLLPGIKWFRAIFIYHTHIVNRQKKQFAKHEANRIELTLAGDISQVTLVYDNFASPPTYGDYIYVILLARYFVAQGRFVNFIIIDSDYRDDWAALTIIEKTTFVSEQVMLATKLLDNKYSNIERLSWDSVQDRISKKSFGFSPFSYFVNKRMPIYNNCFNLLNYLLSNKQSPFLENVLFSYEEFSKKVITSKFDKKYITWACRYSKKWAYDRNISDEEFLSLYKQLHRRYPHHKIMVISDMVGCDYFSQCAKNYELDIVFSKQYSQSFLGDCALILNSDFFFQVRGGGVSVIPMFSGVPYEIISPLGHEVMWSNSKIVSFQKAEQVFLNRTR